MFHPVALKRCTLIAAQFIWLAPAVAQVDCIARDQRHVPKGQSFLHWENDLFTRLQSDEYFTNGLRVGYAWSPGCERPWIRHEAEWLEDSQLGHRLELGDPGRYTRSATFAIGQSIYTPSDIKRADYLPDDHPYGGWLYALTRFDYTTPVAAAGDNWNTQTQRSFELQFGIVGPGALGKEVQTWVHEVMDDKNPEGWGHQLHNEPGLVVSYQWQRRYVGANRRFDVIPSAGMAIGNVQSFAATGMTMRLGQNINGFPSRPNEPARITQGELRDDHGKCLGMPLISACYFFVGAEARFMARNIFLDGNSFRDSPRVERKTMVYDLTGGLRLRMPGAKLTFSYVYVYRSREFEPVPATSRHADGHHEYGVASFSWDTHF